MLGAMKYPEGVIVLTLYARVIYMLRRLCTLICAMFFSFLIK